MPVPKRRHSSARRDKARTHKKLSVVVLVNCRSCGEKKLPHRVCQSCGEFKGRSIVAKITS